MGVDVLPPLPKDAGDRNRTSPFAFTGNRFEFRAVGSNQSIAGPLVAMNTIVAESLDYCATELEKATGGDAAKLPGAVQTLLKEIYQRSTSAIVFNGDGYSEAWHQEAAKRGLPNLKTTVDALPDAERPGSRSSPVREVQRACPSARPKAAWTSTSSNTVKTVSVEAMLTIEMAKTLIFPAAIRYQNELASTCANLKPVGYAFDTDTLDKMTDAGEGACRTATAPWKSRWPITAAEPAGGSHATSAKKVLPAMAAVRKAADELEGIGGRRPWPLPTYQEMLFIK